MKKGRIGWPMRPNQWMATRLASAIALVTVAIFIAVAIAIAVTIASTVAGPGADLLGQPIGAGVKHRAFLAGHAAALEHSELAIELRRPAMKARRFGRAQHPACSG